jgi:hypothetical protein
VSAAQVRACSAEADEFAEAAASDLHAGRNIAATSLAIHGGINSADAVCGARLGHRAAGDDQDQVLDLLRQAGTDGAEIERPDLDPLPGRFVRACVVDRRATRSTGDADNPDERALGPHRCIDHTVDAGARC